MTFHLERGRQLPDHLHIKEERCVAAVKASDWHPQGWTQILLGCEGSECTSGWWSTQAEAGAAGRMERGMQQSLQSSSLANLPLVTEFHPMPCNFIHCTESFSSLCFFQNGCHGETGTNLCSRDFKHKKYKWFYFFSSSPLSLQETSPLTCTEHCSCPSSPSRDTTPVSNEAKGTEPTKP